MTKIYKINYICYSVWKKEAKTMNLTAGQLQRSTKEAIFPWTCIGPELLLPLQLLPSGISSTQMGRYRQFRGSDNNPVTYVLTGWPSCVILTELWYSVQMQTSCPVNLWIWAVRVKNSAPLKYKVPYLVQFRLKSSVKWTWCQLLQLLAYTFRR